MIVPMKKLSLLIPGEKKEQALKALRRLGLIHIDVAVTPGTGSETLERQRSLLEQGLYLIGKTEAAQKEVSPEEALAVAERMARLTEEKKTCTDRLRTAKLELERLAGWGELDPAAFAALAEQGVSLALCELPASLWPPEGVTAVAVEKNKNTVKCVLRQREPLPEGLKPYLVPMPAQSTREQELQIAGIKGRLQEIETELSESAAYADSMKKAMTVCQKALQFEGYAAGMEEERMSDRVTLAYFTGYAEADRLEAVKAAARENRWGLLVEDPTPEDNVPTKLKNNRFVSLVYPLTDFLGTVPGYFEYDISAWFLGFVMIFFGIIFGDGIYGVLITAIAAALIGKALVKKEPVPAAYLLIGMLGLSTVLWGFLTCTWCGLPAANLPVWLQKLSVPWISNVYADRLWYPFWTNGQAALTTPQNLQIFCFTLALIQLSVAHLMGAARNRKSLKMLGDLGSVLQLVGIYYVVLSLVVNSAVFGLGLTIGGIPVGLTAVALVGVGFVMSFVFSNYEGSIGKSIVASLKNIVSVLLGVVNVFSDIVSYIRLWAVGLAGAAIAATVNEMAGPLFGNLLMAVLAVVLLVFGHGLNMILNVLSVIVHGIRLNTLEFSSHLDMSWGGHKFEPFEE